MPPNILANAKRHPREMGAAEVEAFLSLLAVQGKVAASTQNQAVSALLFFVPGGAWDRVAMDGKRGSAA